MEQIIIAGLLLVGGVFAVRALTKAFGAMLATVDKMNRDKAHALEAMVLLHKEATTLNRSMQASLLTIIADNPMVTAVTTRGLADGGERPPMVAAAPDDADEENGVAAVVDVGLN